MEKMSPKKAVLKLAIPTMLGVIVQLIYNLTDTFFVGKTNDPDQVAALSIVLPIFLIIQACGTTLAIGGGSYLSILLGKKDQKKANEVINTSIALTIILGAVLTLIFVIFTHHIISTIGTSVGTYVYTKDYYQIIVSFSILLAIQVTMCGLIRSEGSTGKSMIGVILGNVVNIILDPIFIFTFGMGVKGAAWATVIGNLIGVIYYVVYYINKKSMFTLGFKYIKISAENMKNMFKIGVPAALNQFIMSASFIIVNIVAVKYGDNIVAAEGIYLRIGSVIALLTMGLAQGSQPFAGYNYGAGKYDRFTECFKTTILYGTIISIFFTIIIAIFPQYLFKAFIDDIEVIDIGVRMLRTFAICTPFFGLQMSIMTMFQSIGKAPQALFLGLSRQCIWFIPLLFILDNIFGLSGFIFAQPVSDIITTGVSVILLLFLKKELNLKKETGHKKELGIKKVLQTNE